MTCSICKQPGHNKRTCKNEGQFSPAVDKSTSAKIDSITPVTKPHIHNMNDMIDYVKTLIQSKSDDEALSMIVNELIPLCHSEAAKRGEPKIFDNYNFRQVQICTQLKKIYPTLERSTKRTGKDAWTDVFQNMELKSLANTPNQNPMTCAFPFDKQNDPKRRQETLEYDAFVFSVFYDEKVQIILTAEDKDTISHLYEIIKGHQENFVKTWEKNIADGKRGGHDAIRLGFEEMLKGDFKWNLWINNKWHMNISSEDCSKELQTFHTGLVKPTKKEKTAEEKAAIVAKAKATREAKKVLNALKPLVN